MARVRSGYTKPSFQCSDADQQVAESDTKPLCSARSVNLSRSQRNRKANRVDWDRVDQVIEKCLALYSAFRSIGPSDAVSKFRAQ